MPRLIEIADDGRASLEETADALRSKGCNLADEDSLQHAALRLRRLGNDPDFLGDILIDQLGRRHREDAMESSYGPQVIMLVPSQGDFFIRANIWPSAHEHMVRASGDAAFAIGLPHDHNFSFLTLGYFGPGYWSDYYEYDCDAVAGARGEPVPSLKFIERACLSPGKIQLYRAHLDVHAQYPADSLSVSLNIMQVQGAQGWLDQYKFDLEAGSISTMLASSSADAFLRIAVGLGGAEALDLAECFARSHPSDRLRLTAWDALAARQQDLAERDALWASAEQSGSRLVAMEARARRAELVS